MKARRSGEREPQEQRRAAHPRNLPCDRSPKAGDVAGAGQRRAGKDAKTESWRSLGRSGYGCLLRLHLQAQSGHGRSQQTSVIRAVGEASRMVEPTGSARVRNKVRKGRKRAGEGHSSYFFIAAPVY